MKTSFLARLLSWLALTACLAGAAEPLRVVCWNIQHGEGRDGKVDIARIAGVLRAQTPDVVLLQEVDRLSSRSGKIDQAAEIARLTEMNHRFGKAIDHEGGECGLAILSKFPLGEPTVIKLPGAGEARIVLACVVETPGGRLTAATLYLDPHDEGRRFAQAQVAAAELLRLPEPVVLAGDFNDVPASRTLAVFAQAPWAVIAKTQPAATHPSDQPTTEIDHLVLRGMISAKPARVVAESTASSHRPLVVEIQR